jgi:hypothetical protein
MIRNCWHKAGILPDEPVVTSTPSVPISSLLNSEPPEGTDRAKKDISDSLNHLEELGILHRWNQMDLVELLNPVSEQELVGKILDEEIFQSFVDMQTMEVTGGNDVDDDDDGPDKKPTSKEALAVAFTPKSYIADINKPFACKLESSLASFGRQT